LFKIVNLVLYAFKMKYFVMKWKKKNINYGWIRKASLTESEKIIRIQTNYPDPKRPQEEEPDPDPTQIVSDPQDWIPCYLWWVCPCWDA